MMIGLFKLKWSGTLEEPSTQFDILETAIGMIMEGSMTTIFSVAIGTGSLHLLGVLLFGQLEVPSRNQ